MKKNLFSSYKFRCSGLKHLMTSSKNEITARQLQMIDDLQAKEKLTDKQQATLDELIAKRDAKPELSDTTKAYLRDIYIAEVYGRRRPDIDTKYTKKGTIVESDSLDLVQQVTGNTYFKNINHLENDFIQGTPDVFTKRGRTVIDIKSSWDIWTFAAVDLKKARDSYFYQILGYMWLTGKKQGKLMYCLVNTPEQIISNELYRLSFAYPQMLEGDGSIETELRKNYIFDDIPAKKRVKSFSFAFDQSEIDRLRAKVIAAREYLGSLSL